MKIFKYLHEDRIENILLDNMIRFTQPNQFNDPFEIKLAVKDIMDDESIAAYLKNHIIGMLKQKYEENHEIQEKMSFEKFEEYARGKIPQIQRDIIELSKTTNLKQTVLSKHDEEFNKKLGILSLTTKEDNLLMWAHYCNSHQGFVIEFNHENDFFNQDLDKKNILGKLKEVHYSFDRPYKNLAEHDIEGAYLTKSKEWEYENEYRMFLPFKKAYNLISDNIYLFKFPPNMINAIYCGVNMSYENKNKIKDIINSEQSLNHIKIYQADISDKFFRLEFKMECHL